MLAYSDWCKGGWWNCWHLRQRRTCVCWLIGLLVPHAPGTLMGCVRVPTLMDPFPLVLRAARLPTRLLAALLFPAAALSLPGSHA